MKTTSIMIVGVGGQGSLLASRLLGNLFVNAGADLCRNIGGALLFIAGNVQATGHQSDTHREN